VLVTVTQRIMLALTPRHFYYSIASQFPAVEFNHASRRSVDNTVTMYIVKPLATSAPNDALTGISSTDTVFRAPAVTLTRRLAGMVTG